jgi:hypothetical protein
MAEQATQQAQTQQPVAAMSEAGFSVNVKMLDKFGQEVMLTFRAPQVNQAQTLLGHYEKVVQHLLDGGWQASKGGARPAAAEAPASNGAPVCRVHNVAMRESKNRPGSYYCSKKVGDDYCKEKA